MHVPSALRLRSRIAEELGFVKLCVAVLCSVLQPHRRRDAMLAHRVVSSVPAMNQIVKRFGPPEQQNVARASYSQGNALLDTMNARSRNKQLPRARPKRHRAAIAELNRRAGVRIDVVSTMLMKTFAKIGDGVTSVNFDSRAGKVFTNSSKDLESTVAEGDGCVSWFEGLSVATCESPGRSNACRWTFEFRTTN